MTDARLTFTTSRRLWWGVVVLLVLLWALGGLLPPALADLDTPPAVTTVLLPVARFVRDVAATVTVGCLLVGGLLVPGRSERVLRWTVPWALLWLVSLAALAVLSVSDVLAVGPLQALDPTVMRSFLTDVTLGRVLLWQAIGVVLVLLLAPAVISRPTAWTVLTIAALASAAPALVGHGGLTGGHAGATISLGVHLVSVALWTGGLVAVVAFALTDRARASAAVTRFGTVALVSVIVLAESGLLNASMRIVDGTWLTSDYAALVVAKAALLLWLVRLAWTQRTRVVPALASAEEVTVAALARIAGWELAAMGAAIAVGVTMSRVGPASAAGTAYAVNPLLLALVAVVVPELVGRMRRPGTDHGWARYVGRFPEQTSVLLAVVTVAVAGLGGPVHVLGPQVGSAVALGLLVGAGTLQAVALTVSSTRSSVVGAMAAWAVAVVLALLVDERHASDGLGWHLPLVALLLAEGALATRLLRRTPAAAAVDAVADARTEVAA